jgi:hypothetical protein
MCVMVEDDYDGDEDDDDEGEDDEGVRQPARVFGVTRFPPLSPQEALGLRGMPLARRVRDASCLLAPTELVLAFERTQAVAAVPIALLLVTGGALVFAKLHCGC